MEKITKNFISWNQYNIWISSQIYLTKKSWKQRFTKLLIQILFRLISRNKVFFNIFLQYDVAS